MRLSKILTASLLLAAACYKPTYSSDEDAGKAFRCYATDNPACPAGLVCCVAELCGDALIDPVTPVDSPPMTVDTAPSPERVHLAVARLLETSVL